MTSRATRRSSFLPPIVSNSTASLSRLSVACLVLLLTFAGCGGSEPAFTREQVETLMSDAIRENVTREGGTMDQLTCVEDGDKLHWICTADVRIEPVLYLLTVGITCDAETKDCISEDRGLARQN